MTLNKFAEVLAGNMIDLNDQFNCINNGGCGVVALAAYDELRYYDIPVTLHTVACYGDKDTLKTVDINSELKACNRTGHYKNYSPNGHIVIKVGDVYIDSDGVHSDEKVFTDPLNEFEFRKLVANPDQWNDLFYDSNWTYAINDCPEKRIKKEVINIIENSIMEANYF